MFTGIVDHEGQIQEVETTSQGQRLKIQTSFQNLVPGESIAVDGACLTVVSPEDGSYYVDVSPETLQRTTLGSYRVGSRVNLERSLRVGDAIGGHWVLGHVDRLGRVEAVERIGEYSKIIIGGLLPENFDFLAPKGSITVNGVSLTLNEVGEDEFEVMLIPHTWERTNLKNLTVGSSVNLEFDYLAKLVVSRARPLWQMRRNEPRV